MWEEKEEKILFSAEEGKICDNCKINTSSINECGVSLCTDCFAEQKKEYLNYYMNKPILHLSYNEITQKIILGNEDCARDKTFLTSKGISHILICAENCEQFFPNEFEYKILYLDDAIDEDLLSWLYEAFTFIDSCTKKVYIHCVMGISRSSSVVIGYIMYKEKKSFFEAFNYVKSKREQICPNSGFIEQLKKLEKILKENNFNIEILKDINVQK